MMLRLSLLLGSMTTFMACSDSTSTLPGVDVAADAAASEDLLPDLDVAEDARPEVPDTHDELDTADSLDGTPSGTDESRARAFKLFYRERLDRVLVAFNRFSLFGAEALLGAFQNDFDDVAEAMVTLHAVLLARGQSALAAEAQASVGHLTTIMRRFADVIYGALKPEQQAEQRYEAAIFDAMAGREVDPKDIGGFEIEEQRMARAEGLLDFPAASPWKLHTDEELLQLVTDGLANLQDKSGPGRSDAIRKRYAETYPDGKPPIRRAGDAYEARQGQGPWVPAERPRHVGVGSFDLIQAVVLCTTAPQLLDCSWAAIGCGPLDLDDSGTVDAADAALFEARVVAVGEGNTCSGAECDGADLDQSGTVDASDRAFMAAAQGCVR